MTQQDDDFPRVLQRRATVLVFLPNTNELQRFVWSGAFDALASEHDLHYVLPADDAAKMRAASPLLQKGNTSELTVSRERFAVWQEVFRTATLRYGDLSPSFAIRAGIPANTGRLQAMTAPEREAYDAAYDVEVEGLLAGMEPLDAIVDLFDRHDPLLCVVSTSLLDLFCNDVVWACDVYDVGCLLLQSGWDNVSSKGILYRRTPYMGCWGPQSVAHAKAIQRMSKSRLAPLGSPHYEFLKPASQDDVGALRAQLGVAPDERMLLFGGSFRQFDETSTLEQLEREIDTGRLGPIKVVYRPHPWRAARQHEDSFFARQWRHVIFDPDMRDRYLREQAEAGYIKRNVPMFDMVYLSRLISAADAVISPMSTLLLEALLLDKPTMAIAFGDGKHSHDPSVTSQMTHFAEVRKSRAVIWADDASRLVEYCDALLRWEWTGELQAAREKLLDQVVTRTPGTYAQRLATFCHEVVEPAARKMRARRANIERGSISHAYGANRIARDYCGIHIHDPVIPGYWMHGWIPAYHNVHYALIALHKKMGQDVPGYDFYAQIREEKESTPQWVSRPDQAEFLLAHGYRHVKAIGLPITYIPDPHVRRAPGSLLVLPPHSHKMHGSGDPIAQQYAEAIADLRPRFDQIWVGLHEDDIAKKQWIEPFRRLGIPVFPTTDQADPHTLVRLKRILCSFEYVTTNGYGSHIALAAFCGARVSVFGPYADFPYERMKATHALKMFPELLDQAYYLCTEEALKKNYPFLFREPDKADILQDWAAHEVGEPSRLSPAELTEIFGWVRTERSDTADICPSDRHVRVRRRTESAGRRQGAARAGKQGVVLFAIDALDDRRQFDSVQDMLRASGVDVHVMCMNAPARVPFWTYRARALRDLIFDRRRLKSAAESSMRVRSNRRAARVACAVLNRLPRRQQKSLDEMLQRYENRIPPSASAVEALASIRPDCVVVTSLAHALSAQIDLVKAAETLGIPTVLAPPSVNSLADSGIVKVRPRCVAVWNSSMADEAITRHGLPSETVIVTGTSSFDRWFQQSVGRREAFFESFALNRRAPLVVYVCTSPTTVENEPAFVHGWLRAIRKSGLRKLNILIRPHAKSGDRWMRRVSRTDAPVLWKGAVVHNLADFTDAVSSADAVVTFDPDVLLAAAILGTPVLSFRSARGGAACGQSAWVDDMVVSGGVLMARSLDEHTTQLKRVIEERDALGETRRRLAGEIVRPRGGNAPTCSRFVELIMQCLVAREKDRSVHPSEAAMMVGSARGT